MKLTRIATATASTLTMLAMATLSSTAFAQIPAPSSALASSTTTNNGAAYRESVTRDGRGVIFDDDLSTGLSPGGSSSMLVLTHSASRARLLRPRFHFISEMLKTVENF